MRKVIFSTVAISLILQGCFEQYQRSEPIENRIMEKTQMVAQKVRTQKIDSVILDGVVENSLMYLPQGRDPFIAMGIFKDLVWSDGDGSLLTTPRVRLSRDPERADDYKLGPFEKYDLESLTMIGVMSQPTGETAALIDVGNNKIMMVHKGDYIGKDHGIITSITEKKIVINEKFGAATKENPNAWIVLPNEILLKIK